LVVKDDAKLFVVVAGASVVAGAAVVATTPEDPASFAFGGVVNVAVVASAVNVVSLSVVIAVAVSPPTLDTGTPPLWWTQAKRTRRQANFTIS